MDEHSTMTVAPVGQSDVSQQRLSDEVKDIRAFAAKFYHKTVGGRPSGEEQGIPDRFYLLATVLLNRWFSRTDSLLKGAGITPKVLKKRLKQDFTGWQAADLAALPVSSSALERATRYAAEDEGVPGKAGWVEVEHLLKALGDSTDPAVQEYVNTYGLTASNISVAQAAYEQKKTQQTTLFVMREVVEVVVISFFLFILVKETLGELRLIPSESMVPGLQIGDRLVIEKVSRWVRPYQRGDVVVFYPPSSILKDDPWSVFLRVTGISNLIYEPEQNIDKAYIKRLIGLPGDVVNVVPGVGVFVNGERLEENYVEEVALSCTVEAPSLRQELETPRCAPVMVPEGNLFFMGDNRNHSEDSRYWGFEPESRVIGRAVFRVFPFHRFGTLPSPQYADESEESSK